MDSDIGFIGPSLAPAEIPAAEIQGQAPEPVQSVGSQSRKQRSKWKHLDWAKHRNLMKQLYLHDQKTLEEVMQIMQSKYDFVASKQAYKRSFKDWGFQRYLQRKDAEAMIKILRRRLREHGKKTVFKRGAALFSREQVEKCLARAKRSAADAETIDAATPEGVTYYTPSATAAASPVSAVEDMPEHANISAFAAVTAHAFPRMNPSAPPTRQLTEQLVPFPCSPSTMDAVFSLTFEDMDMRTPSPGLELAFLNQDELPTGHVDGVVDLRGMICAQSSLAPLSSHTDPISAGLRSHMLANVPWLRFRGMVDAVLGPPHLRQSPAFFIPQHVHAALGLGPGGLSLSPPTFALQDSFPLKGLTPAHELASVLGQTVPGLTGDAGRQSLWQLLRPPANCEVSRVAELAFGLISNDLVAEEGKKHFLQFLTHDIPRRAVHALFCVDTITVDAVAYQLLNAAVENGDELALEVLLEAGINRQRISGHRGTALLRTAIQAKQKTIAEQLLRAGMDPNPGNLVGEAWGKYDPTTPLHAAVTGGETDLVRRLIDAGAEVDRADLEGKTALALAVKERELTSAALLLDAGADVNIAWLDDDCNDDIRHSALDYAFLVHDPEMYRLLPQGSEENPQDVVSLRGILSAAKTGHQGLEAYLRQRAHVPKAVRQEFLEKALLGACCYTMHEAAIDALLASGVDPNVKEFVSNTGAMSPLYWVVHHQSSHAVGCLLRRGAKISGRVIQVASSSLYMLQLLIDHGARLDLLGQYGLHAAIIAGNMDTLRFLLQAGADVDSLDAWVRESPIQMAASKGNLPAVKLLILYGADKNGHLMGRAAHGAVAHGQLEILRFLIESGVSINEPTDGRETLLEACARSPSTSRSEIFNYLLEVGAEIQHAGHNIQYRECNSLLTELINHPQDDGLVRLVLDAGVGVNDRGFGPRSQTALQAAAAQGDLDLVKELWAKGADINAPAGFSSQRTALQAACNRTVVNMDLVNFLLEQGADVNAKAGTVCGITALQAAAIHGHTNLAIMLIKDFRADVNADPAIQYGRTALEGAAAHGRLDLVQVLLNAGAKPRKGEVGLKNVIELAEEQEPGHWAVADLLRSHERAQMQGVA